MSEIQFYCPDKKPAVQALTQIIAKKYEIADDTKKVGTLTNIYK